MRQRKIILFELNEVPYRVLDAFCGWRPRSCLARLLTRCSQYETVSEDDPALISYGNLSPWITWPTVHRGVAHARHQVTHFGQDLSAADRVAPPIWRLLAERGVPTGVFGSLHSHPLPEDVAAYAFYLPDSFAAASDAHPRGLESFQAFNLAMVSLSGRNAARGVAWRQGLSLLAGAAQLGLRPRTLSDIGRQLVAERIHPWVRTRRRTYQTVLGFDVFLRQLERARPWFSTFFSNHVASALHRYWAASFPGDYAEFGLDPAWVRRYRGEIDFAMRKFDSLLARLVHFVERRPDHLLLVTSSMGQAATNARPLETQLYVRRPERLMAALGLRPGEWEQRPAMEPLFNVRVVADATERFRSATATLRIVGGEPIYREEGEDGFFALAFGDANLPDDACGELEGRRIGLSELGLENVAVEDRAGTTAFHVPEGHLLIYDPLDRMPDRSRARLSTIEIAPYILQNFGIEPPGYMWSSGTLERTLPPSQVAWAA